MPVKNGMALIFLVPLIAGSACQPTAADEHDPAMTPSGTPLTETVRIRLRNESSFDFDEVHVRFPDQSVNYGAVAKGTASRYETVKRAYRYAQIEATSGQEKFVLQPIDYTGEKELSFGKYTYVIRIEAGRLTVSLVQD